MPVHAHPERFINRELSWLEFDRRVLELARDPSLPALERAKFLAIFSRNLDEFFQVRVSGLQDLVAEGDESTLPDGRTAAAALAAIRERVVELTAEAHQTYQREILPALEEVGIRIARWQELTAQEREGTLGPFDEQIQPVLIPLGVDPAHPFPFVSGLTLSVGVFVHRREGGPRRLARVKVPSFLPRWWEVSPGRYAPVEDLIRGHLSLLFPEDEVDEAGYFRVTRDAELDLEDRGAGDLREAVEAGLYRRRRASDAVRLEVSTDLDERVRRLLVGELKLEADEVYEAPGLLDLGGLMELYSRGPAELKETPWTPAEVFRGRAGGERGGEALFRTLRDRDVLVHHPYESFEGSVGAFLSAAAVDPAVRVIMSTIYRTGGSESSIVQALQGAASRGKQIVVLVELQARFDEAANLDRAQALERAGAHVVYGVIGLKTHAKLAFVVREEADGLRRYCHVGTGNYNPITARLYEDMGLLTSREDVTRDVAEIFQRLTSGSGRRSYERLLVAPEDLRSGLIERIRAEAARPGGGQIAIKANGLSDPDVIDALYAASQAGTRIDLIVRGICCLRPGVQGLSENIRVRSVLGRYLEHSRILRFGPPGESGEIWIGSADLMQRNLDQRVEALVPVDDSELRARLDAVLALYLDPEALVWTLGADGAWKRSGRVDVQEQLHELSAAAGPE